MINKMYSILDTRAGIWTFPFAQPADSVAVRVFEGVVMDRNTIIGQSPQDFDLYYMGTFEDEDTPTFTIIEPQFIIAGTKLKQQLLAKEAADHEISNGASI